MENEFKVGDTVSLKSGGPAMSVCGVTKTAIGVQWFQGSDLKEASFIKDMLRKQDDIPQAKQDEIKEEVKATPALNPKSKGAFSYPDSVKVPGESGPNIQVSEATIKAHTMDWASAERVNRSR